MTEATLTLLQLYLIILDSYMFGILMAIIVERGKIFK